MAASPSLLELRAFLVREKKAQRAERSLVVRGSFGKDDLKLMMDELDPRGL